VELLFIVRDAREDALLSTVVMAMEAQKAGAETGILFTGEAIAALSGKTFNWAPLLVDWDTRMLVSRTANEMGYPLASPRDKRMRWTKPLQLIPAAKDAGVRLLACPLWSKLLNAEEKLPGELERSDMASVLQELRQAQKVIGTF
jgi:peroxiredoxin family protein